jgi:hypothetical protein
MCIAVGLVVGVPHVCWGDVVPIPEFRLSPKQLEPLGYGSIIAGILLAIAAGTTPWVLRSRNGRRIAGLALASASLLLLIYGFWTLARYR